LPAIKVDGAAFFSASRLKLLFGSLAFQVGAADASQRDRVGQREDWCDGRSAIQ